MSVISYIAEKKAKFKNKIESNRTKSMAKKETRLRELEIKNKIRENDLAIERKLQAEESKSRNLRKESFKSGIAGRIAGNIKEKYKAGQREQKSKVMGSSSSIWTQSSSYDNPFSSSKGFGDAPFSKGSFNNPMMKSSSKNIFSGTGIEKKVQPRKTKVRIIEYR